MHQQIPNATTGGQQQTRNASMHQQTRNARMGSGEQQQTRNARMGSGQEKNSVAGCSGQQHQQQNPNATMAGAASWCFKAEEARQRCKDGEKVFAYDLSAKNGCKRFEQLEPGEATGRLRAWHTGARPAHQQGWGHMYEYLGADEAQQFHVDVDLKKNTGTAQLDLEDKALGVIGEVRLAVNHAARTWGLDAGEPCYFNSSTADKGSFHAHFPSLFFANRAIKLEFAKAVHAELERRVGQGAEFAKLAIAGAFDMAVYSSGQRAWRAPYACKMGKQNCKKLWRDGRSVELSELTDEDVMRLFVRTQWPGVAPITAIPNGASASNRESNRASRTEPPAKRRKTGASEPTATDDNNTETLENAVKAAVAYLDNRRPELSKAVKQRGSPKQLEQCTVSVLFGSASKAGYTCPLNASEQHKSNCFAVHVRAGGVCGILCHGCKDADGRRLYVKVVNPPPQAGQPPAEDAAAEANEENAGADDEVFLKFGGKPRDPRANFYHTLELAEQIAAIIVGALNTKTAVTIFIESTKGAGKTTALMHILQRVLQVRLQTTVLMATSRNALASQLALDAREYTKVKLRPRAPDQLVQELECIQGPAVPQAQLPPLPSSFPAVHVAQHTDHDEDGKSLDLTDRRAHPIVSCSVESIGKGRLCKERSDERFGQGRYADKFDIVVIDEITAHLKQHTSTDTMEFKQRLASWDTTRTLCNEATVRIFMCADLTEEPRKFCMERLSPRGAATYKCRVMGGCFTTHVTSAQAVKGKICDVLLKNPQHNVWVASNSLRQSKHVRNLIQRRAEECGDLDLANGVQLFCGCDGNGLSRDERTNILDQRDFRTHVPKTIRVLEAGIIKLVPNDERRPFPIRAFIYTPAITHGFSEQQRETHFTHVFGVFTANSGAPARDAAQQMVRLRGAAACMVGISGGKEQVLDEEEVADRTNDLLTSVEPRPSFPRRVTRGLADRMVYQPHWVLIKPDLQTALGELQATFTKEEERSKINYTCEFLRATLANPHNTVYMSENAHRGNDAKRQTLCAMRECIDDARAASETDVEQCRPGVELGIYDIVKRARKVYGDDKSLLKDSWRLAASEVAHGVAADFKKRILDHPAKKELFNKLLSAMGYTAPGLGQEVPDLLQLSASLEIPKPLPSLVTYVQIARDLVFSRDADRRAKKLNMTEQPTAKDWNSLWTHLIKTSVFGGVALPCRGRAQVNQERLYYSRKLDRGMLNLVQAILSRGVPATQALSSANAKAFVEAKLRELTELASKESKRPASAGEKRAIDAAAAVRVESQMYQRVLRNDGLAGDYRSIIAPPAAEVPLPSSPRPGRRHRYRPAMTDPSIRDQQFQCRRGVMRRQHVKSCYHRQLDALRRHLKMRQLIRAHVERPLSRQPIISRLVNS